MKLQTSWNQFNREYDDLQYLTHWDIKSYGSTLGNELMFGLEAS